MSSTMSVADKLSLGFMTTGLGILVVFVALAMIILIIYALTYLMKERKKEKPRQSPKQAVPIVPPVAPVFAAPVAQAADDSELVAVLTAAVAFAISGDASNTTGLVVRSYRRIDNGSAWGNAGRNSQIFNKL